MSKVFERLMLSQINEYMSEKLSFLLCGYRKGMSSQNCLLFLIEKLKKSLDVSNKYGILLTDLSKAFDCLLHDLLIAKLHAYGFDHLALKLIYSYLSDRFQRVRVNSSYSDWSKILTGVPQGSILGPNLYNYNSNDLFFFILTDICNYADDNSPFTTAPTIPKVISQLENTSLLLLDWIQNNGLKANPDKFNFIQSDCKIRDKIQLSGMDIENSESAKLLGIKIDSKLTFNDHVTELCNKACSKMHALARMSNYMSQKQKRIIMSTFITSHFGYCPLVWMFHNRTLNRRINNIHERALRLVYNDSQSTFDELLIRDNSFTIHDRNLQSLAIELYKVVNDIAPQIMKSIFPLKSKLRYPRESIFETNNVKTVSWGTESLRYIGPKIWSLIPENFKSVRPLEKFKMKIRQ